LIDRKARNVNYPEGEDSDSAAAER
jgi:hypothetical protein